MARATILSSLGTGLYFIRLHFDNSRVTARLASMATKIADYATELAALEPDKTTKTAALNAALTALNDYINATDQSVYVADPTELNALTKATWTARAELDVILHDEKLLKLKKATLEKETANLNTLCPASFDTTAWCVAYNAALSGETEAIECDYLLWRDVGDNQILHDTGIWLPAAVTTPTNALIHPLASSEHATWFNLCMAPAAQRHAGRYRVATLSNLNTISNLCTVTFDGRYDVVKQDGKVIDNEPIYPQFSGVQQTSYDLASIVYGTCHAAAFANGDRVIVDLHSGVGAPTVIGFYDNPRSCGSTPEPGYTGAFFRTNAAALAENPHVIDITGTAQNSSVVSSVIYTDSSITDNASVYQVTTANTVSIAITTDSTLRHTLDLANTADIYINRTTQTGYFSKVTTSPVYDLHGLILIYSAHLESGVITERIMYKMRKEVIYGDITPGAGGYQYDGTVETTTYWLVITDGVEQIKHPDDVIPVAWGDITTTAIQSGALISAIDSFVEFWVGDYSVYHTIYVVQSNAPRAQV